MDDNQQACETWINNNLERIGQAEDVLDIVKWAWQAATMSERDYTNLQFVAWRGESEYFKDLFKRANNLKRKYLAALLAERERTNNLTRGLEQATYHMKKWADRVIFTADDEEEFDADNAEIETIVSTSNYYTARDK